MSEKKEVSTTYTTATGQPVDDDLNTKTAGPFGPALLNDFHLLDKIAHFDRERIPERVVHAKGAGAYGYFEVTHDVTQYCKAGVFSKVGKRTPVFTRFSTVGGEKGSADSARDPRGFAVKHYTDEGIWDMTGNNTPVFFIRDPIKFPDFIHTQKRHPQTNLPNADMFWDFMSLTPESMHQFMILFSDRGTPKSYRHMNGYTSHTFKWVNAKGEGFWIKLHYKTDQGIQNFTGPEADAMKGIDADNATRDLFDAIEREEFPSWSVKYQVMPEADAKNYRFNIFDVTKVWPHADYPLNDLGKLVLNKNPQNYFAETEQAAFSPGHVVPGIEVSPDKMLQARVFSYPDTHRHRLGVNHHQIPVNAPRCPVMNYQRDGAMSINGNQGSGPNYWPNSVDGTPHPAGSAAAESEVEVTGKTGKHTPTHPNYDGDDVDFVQPRSLFNNAMTEEERQNTMNNFAGHLSGAKEHIRKRTLGIFAKVDQKLHDGVAARIDKILKSKA